MTTHINTSELIYDLLKKKKKVILKKYENQFTINQKPLIDIFCCNFSWLAHSPVINTELPNSTFFIIIFFLNSIFHFN